MNSFSRFGAFIGALILAACGGGGGSPSLNGNVPPASSCASDCGTVYVAITDADGDFLSYTVDVVSLKLKRANGTTVETLPATTRIDFAQLVAHRILPAATVPNGAYVAAAPPRLPTPKSRLRGGARRGQRPPPATPWVWSTST
jgi:hypothetical protein